MRTRHLAIEIFELLLSGEERDRKHAVNLAGKLDMVKEMTGKEEKL
jgi:hypothetical protein